MSRATPQTWELAERLVGSETRGKTTPAAFYVCEKLRPYLAPLMGSTGFNALLSRALAVASADDARLRTVHVEADGSLGGFEAAVDPEEMAEASVVLVSQVLGLLVAFVGENLTVRMVRELWPKLPLTDLHFDNGDKI